MVDTALLWFAVGAAAGVACLAVAVQRYRAGAPTLTPLAGVALAVGWLAERAEPSGSLPAWLLESVTVAAVLFVFGVLGVRLLRRWRTPDEQGTDASL